MSKYTDHEHDWQIEYNVGGLLSVKCAECELTVDLFACHLTIADYTTRDKSGLTLRETMSYNKMVEKT